MIPQQRETTNTALPVTLPKHTELVSAAAAAHTRELSDYHHWLHTEASAPPRDTDRTESRSQES